MAVSRKQQVIAALEKAREAAVYAREADAKKGVQKEWQQYVNAKYLDALDKKGFDITDEKLKNKTKRKSDSIAKDIQEGNIPQLVTDQILIDALNNLNKIANAGGSADTAGLTPLEQAMLRVYNAHQDNDPDDPIPAVPHLFTADQIDRVVEATLHALDSVDTKTSSQKKLRQEIKHQDSPTFKHLVSLEAKLAATALPALNVATFNVNVGGALTVAPYTLEPTVVKNYLNARAKSAKHYLEKAYKVALDPNSDLTEGLVAEVEKSLDPDHLSTEMKKDLELLANAEKLTKILKTWADSKGLSGRGAALYAPEDIRAIGTAIVTAQMAGGSLEVQQLASAVAVEAIHPLASVGPVDPTLVSVIAKEAALAAQKADAEAKKKSVSAAVRKDAIISAARAATSEILTRAQAAPGKESEVCLSPDTLIAAEKKRDEVLETALSTPTPIIPLTAGIPTDVSAWDVSSFYTHHTAAEIAAIQTAAQPYIDNVNQQALKDAQNQEHEKIKRDADRLQRTAHQLAYHSSIQRRFRPADEPEPPAGFIPPVDHDFKMEIGKPYKVQGSDLSTEYTSAEIPGAKPSDPPKGVAIQWESQAWKTVGGEARDKVRLEESLNGLMGFVDLNPGADTTKPQWSSKDIVLSQIKAVLEEGPKHGIYIKLNVDDIKTKLNDKMLGWGLAKMKYGAERQNEFDQLMKAIDDHNAQVPVKRAEIMNEHRVKPGGP